MQRYWMNNFTILIQNEKVKIQRDFSMQRKLFALSHHGRDLSGSPRQCRQLFFELRKSSVFEHNNNTNSGFPTKVWLEDNSSWFVPLQEILRR